MFGFTLLILSPLGHLLIRLLALSVFLYGIGYGVHEYARRKGIDVFWTRKQKIVSGVIRNAGRATILILGIAIGYGIRDHQLVSNHVTYTDIDVLYKVNDVRYFVQPARMRAMDITLCNERVDWNAGDLLDDWTFEQMPGCKRVISYHKKPQGELNADVSFR